MTLLDALQYAEQGWPGFLVAERQKTPLISSRDGGHGLYDATDNPERITGWLAAHPRANWGLRTGVTFDVLDVDGDAALDALNAACADREPVFGPTVLTGKGGWHVYVAPTGLGNRAGFIPGCDWRGQGGYVVAPPSIHPNGRRYEWHDDCGRDHPILAAPGWLLTLLTPTAPAVPEASTEEPGEGEVREVRRDRYVQRALESEIARVALAPEGQRNDTLNRAARSLGQLVGAGVLDQKTAVDDLYTVGVRSGLPGAEVERTVASGLKAGLLTPRRLS